MGLKLSLHGVLCSVKQIGCQHHLLLDSWLKFSHTGSLRPLVYVLVDGACAGSIALVCTKAAAEVMLAFLLNRSYHQLGPGIALENQKILPLKGLAQPIVVPDAREPHRWESPWELAHRYSLCSVSSGRVLTCPVFFACQSVSSWKSPSAYQFAGGWSSSWSCSAGLCHDSSRGYAVLDGSQSYQSTYGHCRAMSSWVFGWWAGVDIKKSWLAGWRMEGWAGDGHRRKAEWVVAGEGRNYMPGKVLGLEWASGPSGVNQIGARVSLIAEYRQGLHNPDFSGQLLDKNLNPQFVDQVMVAGQQNCSVLVLLTAGMLDPRAALVLALSLNGPIKILNSRQCQCQGDKKVSWWKMTKTESRWPCRVNLILEHLIGPTPIFNISVSSSTVSLTPLFGWLLIQGMLYCSILGSLTRLAGLIEYSPSLTGWRAVLKIPKLVLPPHSHWCRSLDSQASLAGPCHCLHVAPQFIFIGVACKSHPPVLIATGTVVYIHRYLWLVLVIVCMWRRSLFLLASLQEYYCASVVHVICIIVIHSLEAQQSHQILDYRFLHSKFVKASLSALQSTVKSWQDLLGKSLYYYYYIEMHCCCGSPHNRVWQKFCVGMACLQIL
ncbi:hypothetical protein MP228_004251 [Amoeboaphelidium protococcarum]|nr:hypothetical protein MP228_004251 [Amoeboaphelidium protococcarum]